MNSQKIILVVNDPKNLIKSIDLSNIQEAFSVAKDFAIKTFKIKNIKIIVEINKKMSLPETGISSFTGDSHTVSIYVDPDFSGGLDKNELIATFCHELSHAKRHLGPSEGTTMFDYMIFEGLAVALEEEVCGDKIYFPNYLRKQNPKALVERFQNMFEYDDNQYNYMDFITGNKEKNIPRQAIYIMGFYIVDKYLKSHHKKASELLLEYSAFFQT